MVLTLHRCRLALRAYGATATTMFKTGRPPSDTMQFSFARGLMRAAAHMQALIQHPCAWLRAVWWRLLGKRVRARAQMSPLLGASPFAYRLFLDAMPPVPRRGEGRKSTSILALVEEGQGAQASLASLMREGLHAKTIASGASLRHDEMVMEDGSHPAWLLPICRGDTLATGAGDAYHKAAAEAGPAVRVIYSDDDLFCLRDKPGRPHFKPDWNAELFTHHDYLSGTALLRADCAEDDLVVQSGAGWIAALTRRALGINQTAGHGKETVLHLRRVLHHRRSRPDPRRPKLTHPILEGKVTHPSVSIIVPTRNRVELLRTCLEGVAATNYPGPVEVLVIDNGSDETATLSYLAALDPAFARVLHHPGPFNFAQMNNTALGVATGELVCFLNNDIEMRDPNWLAIMACQALRPDVGAVGARLLYPDGRIQHAGVVLGIGGGAAHAHRLLDPDEEGYFQRHALPQFVSAVTAACLVARRDRVIAVGGFDAENFAVAFNDVDLCLRLNAQGWQSFYEPRATLIHHESVSRGFDRDPVGAARLAGELAALKARWRTGDVRQAYDGTAPAVDPYHHPALSPWSESFVVRV